MKKATLVEFQPVRITNSSSSPDIIHLSEILKFKTEFHEYEIERDDEDVNGKPKTKISLTTNPKLTTWRRSLYRILGEPSSYLFHRKNLKNPKKNGTQASFFHCHLH